MKNDNIIFKRVRPRSYFENNIDFYINEDGEKHERHFNEVMFRFCDKVIALEETDEEGWDYIQVKHPNNDFHEEGDEYTIYQDWLWIDQWVYDPGFGLCKPWNFYIDRTIDSARKLLDYKNIEHFTLQRNYWMGYPKPMYTFVHESNGHPSGSVLVIIAEDMEQAEIEIEKILEEMGEDTTVNITEIKPCISGTCVYGHNGDVDEKA